MPQEYSMEQFEQDVQMLESCTLEQFYIEKAKIYEKINNNEYDSVSADLLIQALNNIGYKLQYA